jgi:hypothetical protein
MITASDERELTLWDLENRLALEQTVQLAGKVDDMWIASGNRLIVQAGYWLQLIGMSPNGLSVRSTRLLPDAPASVQPGIRPDTAFVLSPSPTRPLLRELLITKPLQIELEGDPEELQRYWQDRLAMQIDAEGRIRPAENEALLLSTAETDSY